MKSTLYAIRDERFGTYVAMDSSRRTADINQAMRWFYKKEAKEMATALAENDSVPGYSVVPVQVDNKGKAAL